MNYLNASLKQAELALLLDEVPVGAIVVMDNQIIGVGHNNKETAKLPTGHAEIIALSAAAKHLGSWRLDNATLYVTLEPCMMCLGAIIQARIKKVVYGAKDSKAGCLGGLINLLEIKGLNHYPEIEYLPSDECSRILTNFFQSKRK